MSDIARALRRRPAAVFQFLRRAGGIEPAKRTRCARALSAAEREEISRGLAASVSLRSIAATLGRAPSTVSREVARNGGALRYRAAAAEQRAWDQAQRAKPCKLVVNHRLRDLVTEKLAMDWSPEQVAGWLRDECAHDESLRVSHETIYRSLFVQSKGALKAELVKHLRSRRLMRRSQHASNKGQSRGQIVDAISIRERPAEVDDRAVPGHWEGDLLCGSKNTYIATLVERHSRFTLLVKLEGKDANTVADALTRCIRSLPEQLRRSLTWDRGSELAQHKRISIDADIELYFCDPHSPWQRGTNENTNGLLRQYFPKGTDLAMYPQEHLDNIAARLNERPRKTLGFRTPANKLNDTVAMTT